MLPHFLILSLVIIGSQCFLIDFQHINQNWNNLRVTWNPNVISSYAFAQMPRLESETHKEGFVKISDCDDSSPFAGKRYVKDNDYAVVLLFDAAGYIAGIQLGLPKGAAGNAPYAKQINQPFVEHGNHYFLTAYFTDPRTICSTGRSQTQWDRDGTGDGLYIQNGTIPTQSMKIPATESEMTNTRWTKGKCFYSMGVHYWYDVSLNMTCDDFFPSFILYNKGKLNAFGWAVGADMTSHRVEHPPHSVISQFMTPTPTCLLNEPYLSTMHIYFTDHPEADLC